MSPPGYIQGKNPGAKLIKNRHLANQCSLFLLDGWVFGGLLASIASI